MQHFPKIRQLQYLLTLYDTKNFRKAAEICHITQPTLSAAIKELEALLGLPMLDRSRRKLVVFTPFGQDTIEAARKILPPLSHLMEKAQKMAAPLSGPLRLGIIPTIAPYLLPTVLPALEKKFGNIDFQIVEDMTHKLIEKLHNGTIDIALMAFPYDTKNLNQLVIFEERFFCATGKNIFRKGQKLSLDDLDNHKLLLLKDGHCLREHALSACKLQNISDQKGLSATSLLTLIQMVAQGHGITLLPEMMLKHGTLPKGIVIHDFKNPKPVRKIGVSWRQKDPQEDDIMTIITYMKSILKPRKA